MQGSKTLKQLNDDPFPFDPRHDLLNRLSRVLKADDAE